MPDLPLSVDTILPPTGVWVKNLKRRGTITIQRFEALLPDVTRRTLQRDLKSMVDMGVIAAERATHPLVYRLVTQA